MEQREKKAVKRLNEEFKKLRKELQDKAEFFNDISTDEFYTWTFLIDRTKIKYSYMFDTEEVKKEFA